MIDTRTRPRRADALLFLAAAAMAGCGGGPTAPEDIEDTIFADALGIDLADFTRLESGVYIRDDVVGEGEMAVEGSMPVVEIEGWRRDGSVFQERTVFGDVPDESFKLGGGGTIDVIPGFDLAIRGMRVGGTRLAILPADLTYPAGHPLAHQVLLFEIQLLELAEPEEEG